LEILETHNEKMMKEEGDEERVPAAHGVITSSIHLAGNRTYILHYHVPLQTYLVPHTVLQDEFVSLVGAHLHQAVKQLGHAKAPCVPMSVSPLVAHAVFGPTQELEFMHDEEVSMFLKQWATKTWADGNNSAVFIAPLKLKWQPEAGVHQLIIQYHYQIYSYTGGLQIDGCRYG